MVATKPPRRLVALVFALALAVTLVPSPARAQLEDVIDEPQPDPNVIFVRQGGVKFYQGSPTQWTSFVDDGNVRVRFNVSNSGVQALTVPVFGWLWSQDPSATPPSDGNYDRPGLRETYSGKMFCGTVSVPQRTSTGAGNVTVEWEFPTNDLPDGAYNFTVRANVPRPNDPDLTFNCGEFRTAFGAGTPATYARGYFVKGTRVDYAVESIRWCAGDHNVPSCDDMALNANYSNAAHNQLRPNYFRVNVVNNGTWHNTTDFGGPGNGTDSFYYELGLTVTGPFLDKPVNLSRPTRGIGPIHSANWNFTEKAGWYTLTARIDPKGKLRQEQLSNDQATKDVEIRWVDLTANFTATDFKTTPDDPYPYANTFPIRGNVTLRNDGNSGVLLNGTNYTIYLGSRDSNFSRTGSFNRGEIGPNWTHTIEVNWPASTSPSNPYYISPGRHTLHVEIDNFPVYRPAQPGDPEYDAAQEKQVLANAGNETFEIDEANNHLTLDLYVADTSAPELGEVKLTTGGVNAPLVAERHPHQSMSIHVNVTDEDVENLEVVAVFQPEDDPAHYANYTLTKDPHADRYYGAVTNLSFASNASVENWTMRVVASDPFDNKDIGDTIKFKLVRWPVQSAPADYLVVTPADGANYSWADTDHPRFIIRVYENMTGIQSQPNVTTNMWVNYTTPHGGDYGPIEMRSLTDCRNVPAGVGGTGRVTVCNEVNPEAFSTFEVTIGKFFQGSSPGTWNISFHVADRSGEIRVFNRTFNLVDDPPVIESWLWNTNRTDAGGSFNVSAQLTDDFEVSAVHLNLSRVEPGDGRLVNLTLRNLTQVTEPTSAFQANDTFRTGRGELFGLGGKFAASLEAVDDNGNWARLALGEFVVNDSLPPVVLAAGANPPIQETRQDITFFALVTDETNVTAHLQVLRGSEEIFPRVELTPRPDGNLTYTTNISEEGDFLWVIEVQDSLGRTVRREGTLSVRDNIGPRLEIRSPSTFIDGVRYGSGTPRIEFLVYDNTDGVVESSITLDVAGLPVVPDIVPAGGGVDGYLVSYVVPSSKKFSHQDVVTVNLTARDASERDLESWLNFTFTVDDVAPVARLVSISPSYRDQPSQPLNVSLESRFTLAAEDNDGLPTAPESIRFRILGGGNNAGETIYSGPFRISDAVGVYTGPRLYQIQFWAEDSVGNFNRSYNVTNIYVDDTPPALYQFFPQGRYINATFVDDRVGVDRAVVWYRINDDPYRQGQLADDDGIWSLVLPEGRKGDTISYYLQAWDKLNNTDTFGNQTSPYASFDVSNHEPTIRIVSPAEGSRVSRNVELTWEASDADGDALVFTVYHRPPGQTGFIELARLESSSVRRYVIDTTAYPDGEYTFRVAASDGGFARLAETTVTILNQVEPIGRVTAPSGDILPGDRILVKAEITKSQAVVEVRLYRGATLVSAYQMNDAGIDGDERAGDGIYSVRVPIDAAGDYRVEIFTRYQEDGQTKESVSEEAFVFTAKLTPRYILHEYAGVLLVIGLLALVGVAVAVVVVVRRR